MSWPIDQSPPTPNSELLLKTCLWLMNLGHQAKEFDSVTASRSAIICGSSKQLGRYNQEPENESITEERAVLGQ